MTDPISPLTQIGVVHSPYRTRNDAPFQGRHRNDESTIEIFETFEPGLQDIERCSHLIVLTWMHRGDRNRLRT
ncbi:MAG: tRNA (N6-threonylcarbamoyladenosine(37)-N6)-methyltransferase TrmO, partial [Deltaproteobacteria bacterium]|nr:tRNA (N6-threonylcarbamoyladenosine(37)-N6)-methyltransferase TrmO [Deltaproteobacteria bacterium]